MQRAVMYVVFLIGSTYPKFNIPTSCIQNKSASIDLSVYLYHRK